MRTLTTTALWIHSRINTNDEALLYRNTSRDTDTATTHFLQIKFLGDKRNINGLGATVSIYYDHGKQQVYENNPYRGYLSSMQGIVHFQTEFSPLSTPIDDKMEQCANNKSLKIYKNKPGACRSTLKMLKSLYTLLKHLLSCN